MTRPQWAKITARILRLWPHQTIPDDALAEWYLLLADLDGAAVNAAVTALATSGREFPPPAGVIRAKAAEMERPGATFEQVWAQVQRVVRAHGRYAAAEALGALRQVPLALELVAVLGGWEAVCNAGPDDARPVDPGVWRAGAEHAFKSLALQQRDDEAIAGLPGPRAAAATVRLAGGLTPIADIRPWEGPTAPALQPPWAARQMAALLPAKAGNGLKPEYRAEIERLLRRGEEGRIPERWRQYVAEVKAAMEEAE